MKNHKKTTASKLLSRFDADLKAILINDFNSNKILKHQLLYGNRQVRLQVL